MHYSFQDPFYCVLDLGSTIMSVIRLGLTLMFRKLVVVLLGAQNPIARSGYPLGAIALIKSAKNSTRSDRCSPKMLLASEFHPGSGCAYAL